MKFIILDLEATCWAERRQQPNEIIEIGALCVDGQAQILGEFDVFVKPQIHPQLSDFCTALTSITQTMVDQASPFPEALEQFRAWIKSFEDQYLLCSWGYYDRKQLQQDCELHGLSTDWLQPHISLKHQYAKIKGQKPMDMKKALQQEGLTLEGTHHRGIDDVRNISKIFLKYFECWDWA